MPSLRLLSRFFKTYGWPYRLWFLGGLVFLYFTNWMTVQIPLEIRKAVDLLYAGGSRPPGLGTVAWTILGIGVALIGIRTASRLFFFSPGRYMEADLRKDVFAHLLALEADYYARHPSGELVSKLTNDISAVRALAGYATLQSANVVLGLGFCIYRMAAINPRVTLYTLVPIVLIFMCIQGGLRKVFELTRETQTELALLSSHVLLSYNGIATIRSFGAEPLFKARFGALNTRYTRTTLRMSKLRSLLFPLLSLMGSVGLFVLLYTGGTLVALRTLSIGELAALIGLVATLLPPLMSLGWLVNVYQRGVSALERLYQILETAPSSPKLSLPPLQERSEALLRIKRLSFSYPSAGPSAGDETAAPVLHDISFDLRRGEIIGVFGRTGSGKSTLLSVIARLYSPAPGQITIGDRDALAYPLEEYRGFFAMVPERPFLFSTTIAENIRMGSDAPIGDETLSTLIRESELEKDIASFPKGWDTLVGPRGVMLSGGQRQRITLARALASHAPILLLDDILSAVDHATEERLIAALYRHKRTALLVSHRISALRRADRIMVLDGGTVVAVGTHDTLIRQGGLYADIWRRQCAGDRL